MNKVLTATGYFPDHVPNVSDSGEVSHVYYPNPDATDQGVTGDSDTIKYYIDQIGLTEQAVIYLRNKSGNDTTEYALTTSETLPANIRIQPQPGAYIDGAGTLTITSTDQIIAGKNQQIFGSSITIAFEQGGTVYPFWWEENANDGTTDATSAINSAISSLRTNSVDGTVYLATGTYIVSSINATDCAGLSFLGENHRRTFITGNTADKNVLDFSKSSSCKIKGFTLQGDSGNVPKVGLLLARETGGADAGKHTIENIETNGYFSVAAIYSFASEKNSYRDSIVRNYSNNANCLKLNNDNPDSIASDFQTLAASGANTSHNFFNCTVWYCGTSGYSIWADTADNITFIGGALTTPGITLNISLYLNSCEYCSFIDTRFEKFANTAHIRFAGSCTYVNMQNCYIDHATNSIDAEADTVLAYINISSQLATSGNTVDLSNAIISSSYILFSTKNFIAGTASDCFFEGNPANYTDGTTTRVYVIYEGTKYVYGGAIPVLFESVDPSTFCLYKFKDTTNTSNILLRDSNGDSRQVFRASGATEINTTASVGREALLINQTDEDKSFINFAGTSEAGSTKNISTLNGDGSVDGPNNASSSAGWTFAGMIKTEINGTEYWMPYYSVDTP